MAKVAKRRGRYVLDFYDNQGKRQRMTMKEGTTLKGAKVRLREIEEQINRGLYMPNKMIPTFKVAAQQWLDYKKSNIRPSTFVMYESHIKNHFNELHPFKTNQITTADVEKFIAKRQKEGMNLTTLRKLIVTLNQIMKYAVRHKFTDYNPVRDAERPRGQGGVESIKIQILSPESISPFIGAISNPKYRVLFTLAILGGLRQGELLGLKWSDINWETKQVKIQRTYNNGAWYKPKSKSSERRVDLGPKMIKVLKEWKLACPPNDRNLVFPSRTGKPLDNSTMVRKFFRPALKKAKLPMIRFHDLRHTYASLLIEQGENIKYIQSQLGHSSPTVTLNVYAHLLKPTNQVSAIRLENTIFQPTGHKMVTSDEHATKKGLAQNG